MNKTIPVGKIRVRVAPSPTGSLHLGTAHTALFNYLFAKHSNGNFILRIDDSDRERSKKEFEENIISALKWMNIEWDEGPDIGGPFKHYRQSERGSVYAKYLDTLIKAGKAYVCYCSAQELDRERKEMESKKLPSKYSGKCRILTQEDRRKMESQGKRGAIRLINPNKKVTFTDLIRGNITVDTSLFGDFIIARSDGTALLNFAATVDDIDMKITHAIRGEDFLNMVPRQLIIFDALEVTPPEFAHLSFLYAPDKTKLSKRHGATSVLEYRDLGYLAQAMVNYLGILGYTMSDGREIFEIFDLIKDFDIRRVQKGAPIFDINKLNWYNGHYIRQMSDEKLNKKILNFYSSKYPEEIVKKTIPLVKERIKTLADYLPLCLFFFERPQEYEVDLKDKKKMLADTSSQLKKLSNWCADAIGEAMQSVQKTSGIKASDFFMAIRIAITGKKISPPLNESMEILGKKEVLSRLA